MKPLNKSTRSDRNRQTIAGIRKHYVTVQSLVIEGVSYAPADIEKVLQDSIDAADATAAAAAVFHKAVAAERAANAEGDALYRGLKAVLVNQYKTSPDTLADFGVTLSPRQVPDAATVATAVDKREATRKARHTMGKRQKAGVKGGPPATAPTPPTTAPAKPTST